MNEQHRIDYMSRDNIQSLPKKSLGEMIVDGEAYINDDAGINIDDSQVMEPHSFRFCIDEDGSVNVRPKGKN